MEKITLHKNQVSAYKSKSPITVACSGIQGGKTFVGGLWFKKQTELAHVPDDNFILASPTVPILDQSTMPVFRRFFKGYGEYLAQKREFHIYPKFGGGTIYIRSMSDPWSCEGITNVKAIWGDEAGRFSRLAYINLMGRAAFRQAPIMFTTTPYALNWLYKDIFKAWKAGEREDVNFYQWLSIDNPFFPRIEFDRQRKLLDPKLFAMKYMAQFEKMVGTVFPTFSAETNYYDEFKPDVNRYHICAGVDWGYTNPFAIVPRAVHKFEQRDYQMGEVYKAGLDPEQKVQAAKEAKSKWGIEVFYCDNNEPAMVSLFNRHGLTALAVDKYPGSLKDMIQAHNEILRLGYYKVFKGCCPYTEEEYETYHWPESVEDKEKEINQPENPVDANNHAMTANMYATWMARSIRAASSAPEPSQKTRLQMLLSGELPHQVPVGGDWYNG
jgi:PBSX family phage terminase large subunit